MKFKSIRYQELTDGPWICDGCKKSFYDPDCVTEQENLDGESGWYIRRTYICPFCGSEYIHIMD